MSAPRTEGLSVVVVGGGTAGHIEPALAVGEAVMDLDPTARVTAVGTPRSGAATTRAAITPYPTTAGKSRSSQ